MHLVYFVGITNSGKSTTIGKLFNYWSNTHKVGLIEVGKEMRRRYPPNHFKGLGAMPSTEKEALQIFEEQLAAAVKSGCEIVLCDGQPRMRSQVLSCATCAVYSVPVSPKQVVVLCDVSPEEARGRAAARDTGEVLELSLKRIDNDRIQLYEVLCEIHSMGLHRIAYRDEDLTTSQLAKRILNG